MLCIYKGYGLGILLAEFPGKNWTKGGIDTLLSKLKHTAATEGRLNCVNTTWCGCVEPRNHRSVHHINCQRVSAIYLQFVSVILRRLN